jgi:hypothetical protein
VSAIRVFQEVHPVMPLAAARADGPLTPAAVEAVTAWAAADTAAAAAAEVAGVAAAAAEAAEEEEDVGDREALSEVSTYEIKIIHHEFIKKPGASDDDCRRS